MENENQGVGVGNLLTQIHLGKCPL